MRKKRLFNVAMLERGTKTTNEPSPITKSIRPVLT